MASLAGVFLGIEAKRKPKLNVQGNGSTPLHRAVELGLFDTVTTLVKYGAKLNAVDIDKQTALHMAALNGNLSAVEQLLKRKVKVNELNRWRKTPLDYAYMLEWDNPAHQRIVQLLEQRGGWRGMSHR